MASPRAGEIGVTWTPVTAASHPDMVENRLGRAIPFAAIAVAALVGAISYNMGPPGGGVPPGWGPPQGPPQGWGPPQGQQPPVAQFGRPYGGPPPPPPPPSACTGCDICATDAACTMCESADLCVNCADCASGLDCSGLDCSGLDCSCAAEKAVRRRAAGASLVWLLLPLGVFAAWRRRALRMELSATPR